VKLPVFDAAAALHQEEVEKKGPSRMSKMFKKQQNLF